jgi:deoxyadenosine/deoxycytidine kinase
VYLRASVPTLKRRIAQRGRGFEANISEEYLGELNALYEEWIGGFDLAPVLILVSDHLDFVGKPKDFQAIVSEVEERLRGEQGLLF